MNDELNQCTSAPATFRGQKQVNVWIQSGETEYMSEQMSE